MFNKYLACMLLSLALIAASAQADEGVLTTSGKPAVDQNGRPLHQNPGLHEHFRRSGKCPAEWPIPGTGSKYHIKEQ